MRWLGILVLAVDEMVGDLDYCCRLYDWGFSEAGNIVDKRNISIYKC